MSSEDESNREVDEVQFDQAFGEHTGVSRGCRAEIHRIKNNEDFECDSDVCCGDICGIHERKREEDPQTPAELRERTKTFESTSYCMHMVVLPKGI